MAADSPGKDSHEEAENPKESDETIGNNDTEGTGE